MTDPGTFLLWILPFFLYAETHYRFRYFFSILKKNEPELLADAPFRVEPGYKLPLLLLVKDAHLYPALLRRVRVVIRQRETIREDILIKRPFSLNTKWWWKVFFVDTGKLKGWIELDTFFELESRNGNRTYSNDNYRTSTRKPLRIYISPYRLPRPKKIFYGDVHTHSSYTEDQVEFGAPLAASRSLSRAAGLSFFGVTDHSYDLDDSTENYLLNDPRLPKWKRLQSEVDSLNKTSSAFVILRGEEVSCRNGAGSNVHLLLIGNRTFEQGSGDSAERWLKIQSESPIEEILVRRSKDSLCIAAHPSEEVPFLQRVLIGRGHWTDKDIRSPMLNGIQFLNGFRGDGFQKGLEQWKRALLVGRRPIALAGNDAHGNFNRFRQIGIPFVTIREMPCQIFGAMKTGVLVKGQLSEEKFLDALRAGRCVITDGPFAWLKAEDTGGRRTDVGGQLRLGKITLTITLKSTPEFGECSKLRVWQGVIGNDKEHLPHTETFAAGYDHERAIELIVSQPSYFRLEMTTSRGEFNNTEHFCLTNPIWIT